MNFLKCLIVIVPSFLTGTFLMAQPQKIIFLHTNDVHGIILPFEVSPENATSQTSDAGGPLYKFDKEGEIGGIANLATKISDYKSKYKNQVILLDGGDAYVDGLLTKLSKGKFYIELMNMLEYDFMSLGNHDYDYGKERTKELAEMADFPVRGANVLDSSTNEPFLGEPYIIMERNGIKTGILGLSYRNTPLTTDSKNIDGLKFVNSEEILQKYIDLLKKEANILVVLSHEGIAYDRVLAEKFNDIDLIIGGHSHDITEEPEIINNTRIVQSLSHSSMLGVTTITIEQEEIISVETKQEYLWSDEITADKEIESLIQKEVSKYSDTLFAEIGTAEQPIPRNYKSESPFDMLTGKIIIEKTGAEAALLPGVGYGITISEGAIKRYQLHRLIPHSAKLVTVEMKGEQIVKTLEQSATNLKPEDPKDLVGGLIQTTGISWNVDLNKPVGKRVSEVKINGKTLDKEKWYSVATHSGMLKGLHNYNDIAKGRNVKKYDELIVNIVEDYFKNNPGLKPPERTYIEVMGDG